MKQRYFLLTALFLGLLSSCYDDEGCYDYTDSVKVKFSNDVTSDYTFMVDTPFEMDAPVTFSKEVTHPDETFTIEWYMNKELVFTGYHLKYKFERGGAYELVLKVIHNETGETYLSDKIAITAKNNFDWGWMILSDMGDGKSNLSFITPKMKATHHIDQQIEGGLGHEPKGIFYYYVNGSIPGVYVAGLPKIIINQGSGNVTLDGNSLQKDMWLADEFEGRKEPDNLEIMGFAFKEDYYVICSKEGDVYMRCVGYDNHTIPYYGKYTAMPYPFDGGSNITYFNSFHNNTYWCADESNCLVYDQLNSRFIIITEAYYSWELPYIPGIVYLRTYDKDFNIPSGVLRVDNMGVGTRCLALGAYEKTNVDPETGGLTHWSKYVSIIDANGSGNYQMHEFSVRDLSSRSHMITQTDQYPFSGRQLLNKKSVIRMSTNFEKNPYLYFTDGDNHLYIYSMQLKKHVLAYTASSRITQISSSPIVCEFVGYGGNSTEPNYRLALAQENGDISIIDVDKSKLVKLMEGFDTDFELKTFSGFGDIKGMVWCTNYQGEY